MTNDMPTRLGTTARGYALSRRDFMMQAIAAGASISAASLMASQVQAATPVRGGHYRWGSGTGSISNSLNPTLGADQYLRSLFYALRNCLVEIGPSGELVPELAESWESSDGTNWLFKIRKDVQFHDGKPLRVDDVVASINVHRASQEGAVSLAHTLTKDIEDVKADGSYLKVRLNSPNFDLPAILSFWQLGICPAVSEKQIAWEKGVGTGAYKLTKFEPGVRAVLERNENYWKEGRGHFETAELLVIADTAARTNALLNGEIDAMDDPDRSTAALLTRSPGLVVENVISKYHNMLAMRVDQAPYNNYDVRMALKFAIDRQAMVDTVLSGYGVVGNDHPVPKFSPYFARDLPQRVYDPDRAKFHLKKAGLDKLSVEIKIANMVWQGGAVDACLLYKQSATKAGIDITVTRIPDDGYWTNYESYPFKGDVWAGRPTDNIMLTTAYARGAAGNIAHWDNERFNQLLVASRSDKSEDNRRAMYAEMQSLINDDGGVIIPVFANLLAPMSDKIGHGTLAGDWEMDGARHVERWWFK